MIIKPSVVNGIITQYASNHNGHVTMQQWLNDITFMLVGLIMFYLLGWAKLEGATLDNLTPSVLDRIIVFHTHFLKLCNIFYSFEIYVACNGKYLLNCSSNTIYHWCDPGSSIVSMYIEYHGSSGYKPHDCCPMGNTVSGPATDCLLYCSWQPVAQPRLMNMHEDLSGIRA